ncbi:hypothetical protein J6590_102408 [Homalodisca vitripennis]|nr:hypothetical protein J6590_102408 [Homalodisca vitripennis]
MIRFVFPVFVISETCSRSLSLFRGTLYGYQVFALPNVSGYPPGLASTGFSGGDFSADYRVDVVCLYWSGTVDPKRVGVRKAPHLHYEDVEDVDDLRLRSVAITQLYYYIT